MRRFRSKAVYALPIIFLLVGGEGEDEGKKQDSDDDDDEGEPSKSDEGVTSDGEVTWSARADLHKVGEDEEEDNTSEELTHQIGEDMSHEGSDPDDDGPLQDQTHQEISGKHRILCYDVTVGEGDTLDVRPEDDDEWNKQAEHDAQTDGNPRHVPTRKEDDDE